MPQPLVLITIASSPAPWTSRIQARMFFAAEAWLSRVLPMWWVSAPQQPAPSASTTSQPCRVRRRIVAALIRGSRTRWAQPASSATRLRRGPSAGNTCGRVEPGFARQDPFGASSSIARSCAGISGANGRPSRAARSAKRKRRG